MPAVTTAKTGLWTNNQALVALLGLCPLLAVSNTALNGLVLGSATAVVMLSAALAVALLRPFIAQDLRLPMMVLIIAALVTAVDMGLGAFAPNLHVALGLFIPLIVTNCAILGRLEAHAIRSDPISAMQDGFWMGLGFLAALFALGSLRELIGNGSWMREVSWLAIDLTPESQNPDFLLALLPPGAFFALALFVGIKNHLDQR